MKIPLKTIAYYAGRRMFMALGLASQWNRWWAKKYLNNCLLEPVSVTGVTTFQVVGVPRSGTTLLSTCLDNHSDAICLVEPHMALLLRGGFKLDLPASLRNKYPSEWTTHPSLLLKSLAESRIAKCVGFKETYLTDNYHSLATEVFLKRNVENGYIDKCIAIIRDPRDAWVSVLTRFGEEKRAPNDEFVETWNSFADWVLNDSIFFIRYEDLVADPEALLKYVCVELGLEFEPDMKIGKPRIGVGDRRALKGGAISQNSVGRYSKELDPIFQEYIESHCSTLMRKFGYQIEGRCVPQSCGLPRYRRHPTA